MANTSHGENNSGFRNIGSREAEGIEHDHGNAIPTCIDIASQIIPTVGDHSFGQSLGKIITAHRILIDMIGHHTRSQVMRLIEENRLPGLPKHCPIRRYANPTRQRGQLFCRQKQLFEMTRSLFQLDPTAIGALKDRVKVIGDHGQLPSASNHVGKFARDRVPNMKGGARLPIKLRDQRRNVIFGHAYVHSGQADAFGPGSMGIERVKSGFKKFREVGELPWRTIEQTVESRQPKSRDFRAINPAPAEFGGQAVVWHTAAKPE